jgi:hypothetical protein
MFVICLDSPSTSTRSQQRNEPANDTMKSSNASTDMWVVGLKFKNVNGPLDLTDEIRNFVNLVYNSAATVNMNRENVILDAR